MDKSASKGSSSRNGVVEEIRASLSKAASLLPDSASSEHDAMRPNLQTSWNNGNGNVSKSDLVITKLGSPLTKLVSKDPGRPATSGQLQFECGRLNYSHVKEEWILRHNSLRNRTLTSLGAGSRGSSLGSQSTKQYQLTASICLDENVSGWKRGNHDKISGLEKEGMEEWQRERNHSDTDQQVEQAGTVTSSPRIPQPSLELVQCLLRRAEFISMMVQARDGVLHRYGTKSSDRFVHCSARHQDTPINLRPLILEAALETGGSDCSDDFVKILDDCIMCAHTLSMKLASSLSNEWRFHLADRLFPSEAVHPASVEIKERRHKRTKDADLQENTVDRKSNHQTTKDFPRAVQEFVLLSLGLPWAGFENQDMSGLTEIQSFHLLEAGKSEGPVGACASEKGALILKERSNMASAETHLADDSQKGCKATIMKAEVVRLEVVSTQCPESSKVGDDSVIETPVNLEDISGSMGTSQKFNADAQSVIVPRKNDNSGEDAGTISILERHSRSNPAECNPNSARASRRSPRRKQFRWNNDWKSPLMNLGCLGRSSRNEETEEEECNVVPSVSSDDNQDIKSEPRSEGSDGASHYAFGDYGEHESSNSALELKRSNSELHHAASSGDYTETESCNPTELIAVDASCGEGQDKEKVLLEKQSKAELCCSLNESGSIMTARSALTVNSGASLPRKGAMSLFIGSNEDRERGMRASLGCKRSRSRTPRNAMISSTGKKWENWEHMEFLRLVKVHGRGHWTLISTFLPTRTSTQVKTHAQILMQNLDKGVDIFDGLDEYLKNPGAFGKPTDEELNTMQVSYDTMRKETRRKREKMQAETSAAPSIDRTKWVKLSHMGHISDYHGHSRKYEHFYPLKSGKSLQEVKYEIINTLKNQIDGAVGGPDPDIDEEDASFLRASSTLEALSKKERTATNRKKRSHKQNKSSLVGDLPILFQSSNETPPVEVCTTEACDICRRSEETREISEHFDDFFPNFKCFDDDEEVVVADDCGSAENERRRRSRTTQIFMQKQASARLLNEMFHTLTFIENYNGGFQEEMERGSSGMDDKNEGQEISTPPDEDDGKSLHSKRKSCSFAKSSAKRARTVDISEKRPLVASFDPPFEQLSHLRQLEQYADVQQQNRQIHRITLTDDVESAVKEMAPIIHREIAVLNRFTIDESVLAEERALNRGIRSYSRKADQEKMEKKEFAEKQQTLLRKYECYTTKRKKAESPQEREWKELEARTLSFVGCNGEIPDCVEACPFGSSCYVCSPVLHDEVPHQKEVVNPCFRMIKDQDCFIKDRETDVVDSSESVRLSGRATVREALKMASILKLSELYHTCQFISRYNRGMIDDRKM